MPSFLLVLVGGALGAGCRHLLGRVVQARINGDLPWGTLLINALGGLAMGLLAGALAAGAARDGSAPAAATRELVRSFVGVGLLGGFTTFSAYSLDTYRLFAEGKVLPALLYAVGSTTAALLALALGIWLTTAPRTTLGRSGRSSPGGAGTAPERHQHV